MIVVKRVTLDYQGTLGGGCESYRFFSLQGVDFFVQCVLAIVCFVIVVSIVTDAVANVPLGHRQDHVLFLLLVGHGDCVALDVRFVLHVLQQARHADLVQNFQLVHELRSFQDRLGGESPLENLPHR